MSRLVLNSFQSVYSRPVRGGGVGGHDRTEARGLGVLETRAFLRAHESWEGQRLGKEKGRIYGISPPAGNKGRFLCPA